MRGLLHLGLEGDRSNGMGGTYEQHPQPGGGNRYQRPDLYLIKY